MQKISIGHLVSPEMRIVGGVVGLGGRLILTVSFFGCRFGLSGSSPPESKPMAVRIGGRGGIREPDGCGCGFWSSGFIGAQCGFGELGGMVIFNLSALHIKFKLSISTLGHFKAMNRLPDAVKYK